MVFSEVFDAVFPLIREFENDGTRLAKWSLFQGSGPPVIPTRTLQALNSQPRLAGKTFFTHLVGVDVEAKTLFINHPTLGELVITEFDDIEMQFLDFEVPKIVRSMQMDGGWEDVTPKFFFFAIRPYRYRLCEIRVEPPFPG